jgi:hypothetical protein
VLTEDVEAVEIECLTLAEVVLLPEASRRTCLLKVRFDIVSKTKARVKLNGSGN